MQAGDGDKVVGGDGDKVVGSDGGGEWVVLRFFCDDQAVLGRTVVCGALERQLEKLIAADFDFWRACGSETTILFVPSSSVNPDEHQIAVPFFLPFFLGVSLFYPRRRDALGGVLRAR